MKNIILILINYTPLNAAVGISQQYKLDSIKCIWSTKEPSNAQDQTLKLLTQAWELSFFGKYVVVLMLVLLWQASIEIELSYDMIRFLWFVLAKYVSYTNVAKEQNLG